MSAKAAPLGMPPTIASPAWAAPSTKLPLPWLRNSRAGPRSPCNTKRSTSPSPSTSAPAPPPPAPPAPPDAPAAHPEETDIAGPAAVGAASPAVHHVRLAEVAELIREGRRGAHRQRHLR